MDKFRAILRISAAIVLILVTILLVLAARADGIQEEVWVLCEPNGVVNLRTKPKGQIFGGVQCGDSMWTDGKQERGFLHVLELHAEVDTGWISSRYIVYDRPRTVMCGLTIHADGRVACRQWIGGKIVRWVHEGDVIMVYYMSDEWACTEYGYIHSEFFEEISG